MFKKVTLICLAVFCCTVVVMAQTIKVEPYGVSPRDVESDTMDIFEHAYNGLLNVGVETEMYLSGMLEGASLDNPTWTLLSQPAGSVTDFGAISNMDTSTQVVTFVPDLAGTYVVEFADAGFADTLTINAGTYIGIENGMCEVCHSGKNSDWKETGHYSIFEDGLNGEASDHYASYCISCHVTGYDLNANNNGFDDREFTFPDSLYPGQWDNMLAAFPDAMNLARIQCESCHGPGSAHMGNVSDSKMVSSISSDNCAWCHDSGSHHVYPEQWDVSRHANPEHPYTRSSCAPCHNGAGFVEFVKGGKVGLAADMPENVAITCAACHEPHSDENEHQLRTIEAMLGNDEQVTTGGFGKLCMNCHKSRRDAIEYTNDYLNNLSSHYGPHHGPQGDMLLGTNVPTFGYILPKSAHFSAIENTCVDCHMASGHTDEEGNVVVVGSHSFSVSARVSRKSRYAD